MPNDYKDTLQLPKTDFPMKANLTKKEPEMLAFWDKLSIYTKLEEKNHAKKRYILHDGPPYANGNIHLGTALNKIIKDVIIKYKSMVGEYAPYVPGWDCHGLPIELQVDKKLGSKKHEVGIVQKRKLCREYALKYLDIQREEFKRLGVLGDWNNPYITLDYKYEAAILEEFYKLFYDGYVYKGKKPVHWCPSCVTALAEAEVEYNDKESPSIYVKFKVIDNDKDKLIKDVRPLYIIIWTTTPWTLPANLALAVSSEVEYALLEVNDEIYIVANELAPKLSEDIGLHGNIIKKIPGVKLSDVKAEHPFIDRLSRIVMAGFVSVEEGTGIVHIAPGHGEDDYEIGLENSLDILAPVDSRGIFTEEAAPFNGQFVFKANNSIIETLKERNMLIETMTISHSYPHCWRCKKPVIFRATKQWFISMATNELRQKCLDEIERVNWIPKWGKDRINAMVSGRPDWCISRQRSWGVPIAVFNCDACGEPVKDREILDNVLESFAQHGADVWFEQEPSFFIEATYKCKKCGADKFTKEMDILDVWFDSGVSHAAVLEKRDNLSWPADLYSEGSDQHRGWFQSSLLASTGTRGRSPYDNVLTHGFVVDGKGKKMSKSLGNVIAPQDMIKKSGAETIRLWVCSEDYKNDIRISNEILQRLTEAYRKIRNTCRFLLGNTYDFDGFDYSKQLLEIDKWAMSRLAKLISKSKKSYDNFAFHDVFHGIYNFCIVDMSAFYLDIIKDRVYTFKADSVERRAAQWTMEEILSVLTRLMAPILSFTSEEIWQCERRAIEKRPKITLTENRFSEESVFMADFPEANEQFVDDELEKRWGSLINIRDSVNKALEIRRQDKFIGNSLEASVTIFAKDDEFSLIDRYKEYLPTIFIVSQAYLKPYSEFDLLDGGQKEYAFKTDENTNIIILVGKADGHKCERCWNVSLSVGSYKDYPDICERCYNFIA